MNGSIRVKEFIPGVLRLHPYHSKVS